jgi:hypothetical protein
MLTGAPAGLAAHQARRCGGITRSVGGGEVDGLGCNGIKVGPRRDVLLDIDISIAPAAAMARDATRQG